MLWICICKSSRAIAIKRAVLFDSQSRASTMTSSSDCKSSRAVRLFHAFGAMTSKEKIALVNLAQQIVAGRK